MRIIYSDSVEQLAGELADRIAVQRRVTLDPLRDIRVVVPNQNLAKWLKLFLARERGLCAGIQFPFVESALWELAQDQQCDRKCPDRSAPVSRLTSDILQQAVAAALIAHEDTALRPFRSYCLETAVNGLTADDLANPDCSRRLWQLSGRLAAFFREYDFQRSREVEGWLRDPAFSWFAGERYKHPLTTAQAEMEAAQRSLYRALFLPGGLLAASGPLKSLRQLEADIPGNRGDGQLEQVHFFSLSSISPLYAKLLYRLSSLYDICIYHFNVCMEYWEDIDPPWIRLKAARRRINAETDEETLDLTIENELLNLWGLAGRETLKLLADLDSTGDPVIAGELEAPPAPEPDSVLSAVQWSIRHRTSTITRRPQDQSLQVVSCPGIQREVEMVHNAILASLLTREGIQDSGSSTLPALRHDNLDLQLTDIAVLVPDMALYQSAIEAVFDARGQIPYNLADSNASRESVYGNALLALLQLAGGAFTRREVFEVLYNPCLQAGIGATREDIDVWLEWADKLGIFHSFDKDHRARQELPVSTRFTWDQALARIRLGRILDDPDLSGAIGPPHADINTSSPTATHFSILTERLFKRLQQMAGQRLDGSGWKNEILDLMTDFLDVPPAYAPEMFVRSRICTALEAFAHPEYGLSGFLRQPQKPRQRSEFLLPLAAVRQYLNDVMAAIPCGRGSYLTGGVTIASLQPMRPIPFKHVYILGLGEGGFPGTAEKSTLDLRAIRRRVGDTSRPDANRHLFLETLMATRNRLVLSYVGEDIRKDEKKFPGSILKQLMRFVADHILDGGTVDAPAVFREIPLPLDEADDRCVSDSSGEESWNAGIVTTFSIYPRMINRLRAQGLPTGAVDDPWRDLRTHVANSGTTSHRSGLERRLLDFLNGSPPPAPPAEERAGQCGTMPLRIRDLAKFLEDPAQAVLQRRLKLYDTGENTALLEFEPLNTGHPHDYSLISNAVDTFIRTPAAQRHRATLRQFLRDYRRMRRSSQAPDGIFAILDRAMLWAGIQSRIGDPMLQGLLDSRHRAPQPLVIGDEQLHDVSDVLHHPPCVLHPDAQGPALELSGSLPLWLEPQDGDRTEAVLVLVNTSNAKGDIPPKALLEPFLGMLALRAGGPDGNTAPFAVVLCGKDALVPFVFRDISPMQARSYLEELARDYLAPGSIRQLLPYSVLRETCKNVPDWIGSEQAPEGTDDALREAITSQIEDDMQRGEASRGDYKPSEAVALVFDQLAVPLDIAAVVRRRFRLPWSGSKCELDTTTGIFQATEEDNGAEGLESRSVNSGEDRR